MNLKDVDILSALCAAVALRAAVSLHSYSGEATPPMYGDYEAQRHWQEVTTNLFPQEWYTNTSMNDLLYWGLDYPPLTAYHSYLLGVVGYSINQSFVALGASRGIESKAHKSFMRLTVLFGDVFLYIPSVLALCGALKVKYRRDTVLPFLLPILMYPGQVLIDNGHFQYNNISLGLAALAIASILNDNILRGAFCYTLALNYKQMELYHALPFFIYLLQVCFQQKRFQQKLKKFFAIGCVVVLTFAFLWMPWLRSVDDVTTVLERLFPLGRGVFEDKVGNFWCVLNVVYKIKNIMTNSEMALLCLAATVAAVLPINVHLFMMPRKLAFLQDLTSTALAFFLFSFQVHEKSILLVALPAFSLLAPHPVEVSWFIEITAFSMVPLFIKDGLIVPFFAMMIIYHICVKCILLNHAYRALSICISMCVLVSTCLIFVLTLLSIFVPAPKRYPYFWPLIISVYSFVHFVLFYVYIIIIQVCYQPKSTSRKSY